MKLYYSPDARSDLRELHNYISRNLRNPEAAKNITEKILKTANLLMDQPQLGVRVSEKTGRETDIRCLFSGNYGIFYRINDSSVLVLRILDARTDYMKYVFA